LAHSGAGRIGWRALSPLDWRDQPVSAPRQSFDVLRMIGIVGERLPQDRHRDVDASVEFYDSIVRPKNLPDLLASYDVAVPFHQDSENLEWLLAQQDLGGPDSRARAVVRGKLSGSNIELEVPDSD
jgi:hypothetical protein